MILKIMEIGYHWNCKSFTDLALRFGSKYTKNISGTSLNMNFGNQWPPLADLENKLSEILYRS